jgi:hypothetical protein
MSQSLSSILDPFDFQHEKSGTIYHSGNRTRIASYMAKILRELKSPSLAIDGASDHVTSYSLLESNYDRGRS